MIAFAYALKDGYVWESHYILENGVSDLHFTLYRPTWITAGDSVLVTATPDDGVCNNNTQDMHPWPVSWADAQAETVWLRTSFTPAP